MCNRVRGAFETQVRSLLWILPWAVLGLATPRVCAQMLVGEDLLHPASVILTPQAGLLVVESGAGQHTGRVTFFKENGQRFALLDGLPSGMTPEADSGPTALALEGRQLFIVIGEGDIRGVLDEPGPAIPNPLGPSSPIFSSVLSLYLPRRVDLLSSGFQLSVEDQFRLADGLEVNLVNGQGLEAKLKIVADIQDLIPDPITRLRPSNPYGIQTNFEVRLVGLIPYYLREIYVNDASRNTLFRVSSGRPVAVAKFDPIPNPLAFGPPVSEPVPTSVRRLDRDHLLVSLLVGFPFPAGTGEVRIVNRKTGAHEQFIGGLTSPVDLLVVEDGEEHHFVVLEFSNDFLQDGPGRLLWFESRESQPITLAENLASPTGMARNSETGEIFITQIFPGNLIVVNGPN